MRRTLLFVLAAVLGALALAPAAAAAPKTTTYRSGPIDVGPYQVRQSDIDIGIPTPDEDGYVTGMEVDIVDADGSKVPIRRLMLHHIVFSNLGTEFGEKAVGSGLALGVRGADRRRGGVRLRGHDPTLAASRN